MIVQWYVAGIEYRSRRDKRGPQELQPNTGYTSLISWKCISDAASKFVGVNPNSTFFVIKWSCKWHHGTDLNSTVVLIFHNYSDLSPAYWLTSLQDRTRGPVTTSCWWTMTWMRDLRLLPRTLSYVVSKTSKQPTSSGWGWVDFDWSRKYGYTVIQSMLNHSPCNMWSVATDNQAAWFQYSPPPQIPVDTVQVFFSYPQSLAHHPCIDSPRRLISNPPIKIHKDMTLPVSLTVSSTLQNSQEPSVIAVVLPPACTIAIQLIPIPNMGLRSLRG